MPISNYPQGFTNGLTVRNMPVEIANTGQVFWVNNSSIVPSQGKYGSDGGSGNTGNLGTYLQPFATIEHAIAVCVSGRGDLIMVMPHHAETISSATQFNISGNNIAVVGVALGAQKPTLTLASVIGATITISGAGCSMQGILITNSLDQITNAVTVTGADCYLDIETRDSTALIEMANLVTCNANYLQLNLKHTGFPTTGRHGVTGVTLNGVVHGKVSLDYQGLASTAVVNFITTACAGIEISGLIWNGTTPITKDVVDTITGSVWIMHVYDMVAGASIVGGNNQTPGATSATGIISVTSGVHTLPQTVSSPGTVAATITGGPILVRELSLEITTAVQAQACTVQFAATDTASSTTTTFSAASASISAMAVGSFLRLDPITLATAPVVGATGGVYLGSPGADNSNTNMQLGGVHLPAGTIGIITSASNTGAYKLHLRYEPLGSNVNVLLA